MTSGERYSVSQASLFNQGSAALQLCSLVSQKHIDLEAGLGAMHKLGLDQNDAVFVTVPFGQRGQKYFANAPEIVLVGSPSLAQELMRDDLGRLKKGMEHDLFRAAFGSKNIFFDDDQESWKSSRKDTAPYFAEHAVEGFFRPKIESAIRRNFSRIDAAGGKTSDLRGEFRFIALDTVLSSLFDYEGDFSELAIVRDAYDSYTENFTSRAMLGNLNGLEPQLDIIKRFIDKVSSEQETRPGILANHLNLGKEKMDDLVSTYIFAGFATSGTTLTWCNLLLAENSEIRTALAENVRKGSSPETSSSIRKLLHETLRVRPTAPFLIRRAEEPIEIGSQRKIQKGALVVFALSHMGYDPRLWSEPKIFNPERADIAENRKVGGGHKQFGIGKRKCQGEFFTMLEMEMIEEHLLRNYDLDIPNAEKVVPTLGSPSLRPHPQKIEASFIPTTQ